MNVTTQWEETPIPLNCLFSKKAGETVSVQFSLDSPMTGIDNLTALAEIVAYIRTHHPEAYGKGLMKSSRMEKQVVKAREK